MQLFSSRPNTKMKIWIDLDNTPHVPFFKPIIRELEKKGYNVELTARDAFQVCELANLYGLTYEKVGKHYGKNPVFKVLGLCWRTLQLLPFFIREKPALGLSHGSRAQILLCNLLRVPTVMIMDYEHAQTPFLLQPRWEIIPDALSNERVQCKVNERILTYEGIKEDVYAPEFQPDSSIEAQLNLDDDSSIVVTVRPPANEAHYHNTESDELFVEFMNRVCSTQGVKAILLPRNKLQESQIRRDWPQWFKDSKVLIPKQAVNGLDLLWRSDLVVSGGGTMNREAAALGVPVYSIFRGKSGAVDRHLQNEGRLMMIENIDEVKNKILLQRRNKGGVPASLNSGKALNNIVAHIDTVIMKERSFIN